MKRLCLISMLVLICAGCIPLMHKTVAEQSIRMDKNLNVLLPSYKEVLNDELEEAEKMPDGEEKSELLEGIKHDILLLDATLLLSEDMKKTAETVLKEKE